MLLTLKQFIDNLIKTLLSIARVAFLSKFKTNIDKEKIRSQIVILGNGPSFKNDLNIHRKFLLNKDLICVNHFPSTPQFTELKPKYLIISAPDLWLDDIDEHFIIQSNHLFKELNDKTTWPLTFFVPFEAAKHKRWQDLFRSNVNIKVRFYNNIAVEGFRWFRHLLFNLRLGMPRPHNIMIPSMMMAIAMGYKEVFLWGADHSWLGEIKVTDQNEVLLRQKHFYDEQTAKAKPLDKRGKGHRRLHEILHKFMTAFEGYFYIRDFAKSRNVKIINTTKDSFIDAFDRLSLDQQLKDDENI